MRILKEEVDYKLNTKLRLAGYIKESIVDGPGIRFVLFSQGCPHNCEGCHNPETHNRYAGKDVELSKILALIDSNPLLSGVTFSGGEPFLQPEGFYELAKEIKKRDLSIITYTGYKIEYLLKAGKQNKAITNFIKLNDYIVDSKFEKEKRTYDIPFVGSSNQRIIDIENSFISKEIITTRL